MEAEVQSQEESWDHKGFGCALQLRCLHRLFLILTGHGQAVGPKNENTLALTFIRLSGEQILV